VKTKRVDIHLTLLVPQEVKYVTVDRSGRVRGFSVAPRRYGFTWQVPDFIEEPEKHEHDVHVLTWVQKLKVVDWNRNMTAGKLPQDAEIRAERTSLYLQERSKTYTQTQKEKKINGRKIVRVHADGTRTSEPLSPSRRAGARPRI
jgi:hypothetical protein